MMVAWLYLTDYNHIHCLFIVSNFTILFFTQEQFQETITNHDEKTKANIFRNTANCRAVLFQHVQLATNYNLSCLHLPFHSDVVKGPN